MTTLHEEDELFGADLSMDFYETSYNSYSPSHHAGNNVVRPWQSSPPAPPGREPTTAYIQEETYHHPNHVPTHEYDRYREPYELLDDVPPADLPNNAPYINHPHHHEEATIITARENRPSYPVEELYPAVDDNGNGSGLDARFQKRASPSRSSSLAPAPRYSSQRPPANYNDAATTSSSLGSRYPIDDIVSVVSSNNNDEDDISSRDSSRRSNTAQNSHDAYSTTYSAKENNNDSASSQYSRDSASYYSRYDNSPYEQHHHPRPNHEPNHYPNHRPTTTATAAPRAATVTNDNRMENVSITESRSDHSEISEYHALNSTENYNEEEYSRQESEDPTNYHILHHQQEHEDQYDEEEDDEGFGGQDRDISWAYSEVSSLHGQNHGRSRMAMSSSSSGGSDGSNASANSFDRLYNDEIMDMEGYGDNNNNDDDENMGVDDSSGRSFRPSHGSSFKGRNSDEGLSSPGSNNSNASARGNTLEATMPKDTPMSEEHTEDNDDDFSAPGDNNDSNKWSNVKVDVVTPQRPNRMLLRGRPASPYPSRAEPPTPARMEASDQEKYNASSYTANCPATTVSPTEEALRSHNTSHTTRSLSASPGDRNGINVNDGSDQDENTTQVSYHSVEQTMFHKMVEKGQQVVISLDSSHRHGTTRVVTTTTKTRSNHDSRKTKHTENNNASSLSSSSSSSSTTMSPDPIGRQSRAPSPPPRQSSPAQNSRSTYGTTDDDHGRYNSSSSSSSSGAESSSVSVDTSKYARKYLENNPRSATRKEDPPDSDIGYYPPSSDAREPEGHRQHRLFPDIDLWGDGSNGVKQRGDVHVDVAASTTSAKGGQTSTSGEPDAASRYYEPREMECEEGTHGTAAGNDNLDYDYCSGDGGRSYDEVDDLIEYKSIHAGKAAGVDRDGDSIDYYDGTSPQLEGAEGKEAVGFKSKDGRMEQDYGEYYGNNVDDSIGEEMSFYEEAAPKETRGKKDAVGFKSRDGQIEDDYYHNVTADAGIAANNGMEVDFIDDSSSSSSNNSGEESSLDNPGIGNEYSDVSVISEDTDIRLLTQKYEAEPRPGEFSKKNQPNETMNTMKKEMQSQYQVKQKDSMESDMNIKIDFYASRVKAMASPLSLQKEKKEQKTNQYPYEGIKRNDSMEKEMIIDFKKNVRTEELMGEDGRVEDKGSTLIYDDNEDCDRVHHDGMPLSENAAIVSPPRIQRKPYSFDSADGSEENSGVEDDNSSGQSGEYYAPESRSIVSEESYHSSEEGEGSEDGDDMTEASDDPTLFPSKAISKMNLGHHPDEHDGHVNELEDLTEQACHHLSRGRNNDALIVLTEALQQSQEKVDDAKEKLDKFYLQKKGRSKNNNGDNSISRYNEDELEDDLDATLQTEASAMANILNNLGVVYEIQGEYQRAMNSFRDALDVYRTICHRYENAGDSDVDRTVSNILQMGIAVRSRTRREELHAESDNLAHQTKRWLQSDCPHVCTQLRMERLNVLMSALDLETESLGRNHPAVGHTLLKKGSVHLELTHVDMAIKDTMDGVEILKKGLGHIHPEVGLALMRLGDIYNYHVGPFGGGGWDHRDRYDDNKDMALSLYREALISLRESFGRVNPHLGLAQNSIGILYFARREWRHAMKYFYKALSSYGVRSRPVATDDKNGESMTANEDDKGTQSASCSRPDVFFLWINVGSLHMEKSEWQLSLRSYLKAHSAFRCLNEEQRRHLQKIGPRRLLPGALRPTSMRKQGVEDSSSSLFEDSDALLASVLQNIGKAQSMLHHYGKAVETLEEALQIHRVIAMRGLSSSQDIARILENLGEVLMISGDLTSAFGRYVESLNLLRSGEIVNDSNGIEVALVLGAIGQVHLKKGEYAEANVVLKECMRTFEKMGVPPNNRRINDIRSFLVDSELALMQNATTTLAAQRREISAVPYKDKALAIDELADAYKNKGDHSSAIWFYSEALGLRRRRVDQLSSSANSGRKGGEVVDVGRTLWNIAKLRRERREFGAAKILFDEAGQCFHKANVSPNHPFYRDLTQDIEAMRKM